MHEYHEDQMQLAPIPESERDFGPINVEVYPRERAAFLRAPFTASTRDDYWSWYALAMAWLYEAPGGPGEARGMSETLCDGYEGEEVVCFRW